MSTMDTFSGKRFDPLKISREDISLTDIAHALSLLSRGGGHIRHFYTVGQHSLNCAKEAKARGWTARMQLACLLHDGAEAYISDIVRPVKVHLDLYRKIEKRVMEKVWEKFGLSDLTQEEHKQWRLVDDAVLDYELKYLMTGHESRVLSPLCSRPDVSERPWKDVEEEFTQLAEALIKERG